MQPSARGMRSGVHEVYHFSIDIESVDHPMHLPFKENRDQLTSLLPNIFFSGLTQFHSKLLVKKQTVKLSKEYNVH